MKIKISDLMDHVQDPGMRPGDKYEVSAISTQSIKEKTMSKIDYNSKKRRIRPRRMFLIAAAIMTITAVTATAAVIGKLDVRKMDKGEVLSSEGGHMYVAQGNESVININPQKEGYMACFKPTWLPEDAGCIDKADFSYSVESYAERTGESVESAWEKSGITQEEAENYYTTLWNNPEGTQMSDGRKGAGRFFRIDLYDGTTIDGTNLIMEGDLSNVREGEINGMSATYMTENRKGYIKNNIVLFSEEYNCLVHVVGNMDFDELEKIAQGLIIKQTGLKSGGKIGNYSIFSGGLG